LRVFVSPLSEFHNQNCWYTLGSFRKSGLRFKWSFRSHSRLPKNSTMGLSAQEFRYSYVMAWYKGRSGQGPGRGTLK
jgi:hypothetical protein